LTKQKINPYADAKLVDSFVERFYAGEYRLKPEANTTTFIDDSGKSASLQNLLSEAISNYMTARSVILRICTLMLKNNIGVTQTFLDASKNLSTWTNACLHYITHARNLDLIIETESLSSKLEKLQKESELLKAENLELKKKNVELNRFSKNFPDSQDGNEKDDHGERGDLHPL
jgi:hypothetical protein